MEGSTRKTGSVKWFSRVKGYGFIAPDDQEKEIFVHFSGIDAEGYRNLEQGQRVTFEVEDTPKGPQAVHVTIVAAETEAKAPSEETSAGAETEAEAPGEETSAGAETEAEAPGEETPVGAETEAEAPSEETPAGVE